MNLFLEFHVGHAFSGVGICVKNTLLTRKLTKLNKITKKIITIYYLYRRVYGFFMQISSNYTFKNSAPSFGVDIHEKLFDPMNNLMAQVFEVDKYMRKRELRPHAPITKITGLKQRFEKLVFSVFHWFKKSNERTKNLTFDSIQDIIGVRQRLSTSLNIIDLAMPGSESLLHVHFGEKGEAFLAVNNRRGEKILLRQINKNKFNKPGDFASLKIRLDDIEAVALKLHELGQREHRFDYWKTILPLGVSGKKSKF